ncbi:MAG TPA: vanadium-dependent haloperoxidase [Candidatus Eisenbacteria bacterium]|nr:vanadium-dependent haloperoxidase [Candidatus Eisenbacteria bacterium]
MSKGLLISGTLALVLAGCGTPGPTAPRADRTEAESHQTFLIANPTDPRLPAPGTEAASATDEDRALAEGAPVAASAAAVASAALAVAPNPTLHWNRLTTEFAVGRPPPLFSRAYAVVHVGISDALVAAQDRRRGPLSEAAVAAGAAYEILRYLFPERADRVAAEAAVQAGLSERSGRVLGGWSLGRAVGRLAVDRAKRDGSDAPFTGTIPTGDGLWTGANPVLPLCGTWKCWLIPAGSEFMPEPPFAFGSAEDLSDVDEVLQVSLNRTPDQIAIVHKWADRSPPAIWNSLLLERLEAAGTDPVTSARSMAWLHMTMADAFISCWAAKYTYWTARPIQRIPGLVTVIPTPNFPTYTSGHSTISGAAAEVMAELYPSERAHFAAEADEAAFSRLLGGIHFTHDNDEGLRVGRLIGAFAVSSMRAPHRGPGVAMR